jgi:hypothetical protein
MIAPHKCFLITICRVDCKFARNKKNTEDYAIICSPDLETAIGIRNVNVLNIDVSYMVSPIERNITLND